MSYTTKITTTIIILTVLFYSPFTYWTGSFILNRSGICREFEQAKVEVSASNKCNTSFIEYYENKICKDSPLLINKFNNASYTSVLQCFKDTLLPVPVCQPDEASLYCRFMRVYVAMSLDLLETFVNSCLFVHIVLVVTSGRLLVDFFGVPVTESSGYFFANTIRLISMATSICQFKLLFQHKGNFRWRWAKYLLRCVIVLTAIASTIFFNKAAPCLIP